MQCNTLHKNQYKCQYKQLLKAPYDIPMGEKNFFDFYLDALLPLSADGKQNTTSIHMSVSDRQCFTSLKLVWNILMLARLQRKTG